MVGIMKTKTCVHGIVLEPAISIPPKITGCVICHNLPRTLNWDPWCFPKKSYSQEDVQQMLMDIETLLKQREEAKNKQMDCPLKDDECPYVKGTHR